MSSLDFTISEWDRESFTLTISVVDPAPDSDSDTVYKVAVATQEVYFEAPTEAEVWDIVEKALSSIKEFLDYEKF